MKDLSTVNGTMSNIIQNNTAAITNCKSVAELSNLLSTLFTENNLNTPASRRLLQNVSKKRNIGDAHLAVYSSMLCGSNMKVI